MTKFPGNLALSFLLISICVVAVNCSTENPTPPLDKVTKAFELLDKWNTWFGVTDFKDELDWKKQLKTSDVGAPCEEPATETVQRAYYLRIAHSIKSGAAREESLFKWAVVIANGLSFYEKQFATVPSRKNEDFCGFEVGTKFDVTPDKYGFLWPTNPPLLVCNEATKKCARCRDIDENQQRSLHEACNLLDNKDTLPQTSEGQQLYEQIKEKLQKVHEKGLAKEYGEQCKATEEQTGAFIQMWNLVGTHTGRESTTKAELELEWTGIKKVEEDLQKYKDLYESFTDADIDDEVYCDPTFKGGVRKVGEDSLMCGGESCKGCRDNPPRRDGEGGVHITQQTWRYEYGPLFEACSSINGVLFELERTKECPTKPVCPTVKPLTKEECEKQRGFGGMMRSGKDGAGGMVGNKTTGAANNGNSPKQDIECFFCLGLTWVLVLVCLM